ncbi:MAG: hypothetical protein AABW87_03320, partial [Nanoarchaeota archaeon]
ALLKGIPTNPTVTIPKIRNIRMRKSNVTSFPAEKKASVASVRYLKPRDSDLSFDNLGYAVITLNRIPKEADVPDSIVIGIEADIDVDVYEGMGVNIFEDVLRQEKLDDWKKNRWKHRSFAGFINAKEIKDSYAVFDVYDDNLALVVKDMRVNKGATSSPLRTTDFAIEPRSLSVFDKFKIKVNDITKQTDKIWFLIEREGKIETRTVREGQEIYPGSVWKIKKIEKAKDKIFVYLMDTSSKREVKFEITKTMPTDDELNKLGGGAKEAAEKIEEGKKLDEKTIGQDIEEDYKSALVSYRKVVDDYSSFNDENITETVKKAQEGIVRVYEGLTEIGKEGIVQNIDELDRLKSLTTDDAQRRIIDIKKNIYELIRNKHISSGEYLSDTSGSVFVIPFNYEEAHDTDAVAVLKLGSAEKVKLKEGEEFDDPADKKKWKIEKISPGEIEISRIENGNVVRHLLKIDQVFCSGKDEKDKNKCITLLETQVGREVYITVMPQAEAAYTKAVFNLHVNIDKRAFDLPLFSGSLDEEINKTQDLIKKLNGIIENARSLHEFWTKFCFVTFGVLWSTTFFGNILGLDRSNLARDKIKDKWHSEFGRQSEFRTYDQFIFANQDRYDADLERAGEILDEIIDGRYSAPPGVNKTTDEAKD